MSSLNSLLLSIVFAYGHTTLRAIESNQEVFVSARQRERLSEYFLFKSLLKSIKVLSAFLVFLFLTTCQQPCAVWGVVGLKWEKRTDYSVKTLEWQQTMGKAMTKEKDNDDENIMKQTRMKASGSMQKRHGHGRS